MRVRLVLLFLLLCALPALAEPGVRWVRYLGESLADVTLVDQQLVYLLDNRVTALDPHSGKERWTTRIDFQGAGRLETLGQRLLVVREHSLDCLDIHSGKTLWKFTGDFPQVVGGRVVALLNHRLCQVDVDSGKASEICVGPWNRLERAGERLIGWGANGFQVMDSRGRPLWTRGLGDKFFSGSSGVVLFERGERYSASWKVEAVDSSTGARRWQRDLDRNAYVLCHGAVVGVYRSGRFTALDLSSGKMLWERGDVTRAPRPDPTSEGFLLVESRGKVERVRSATGRPSGASWPESSLVSLGEEWAWGDSGRLYRGGRATGKVSPVHYGANSIFRAVSNPGGVLLGSPRMLVQASPSADKTAFHFEGPAQLYVGCETFITPGNLSGSVSFSNAMEAELSLLNEQGQVLQRRQLVGKGLNNEAPFYFKLEHPGRFKVVASARGHSASRDVTVTRYGIVAKVAGSQVATCVQDCVSGRPAQEVLLTLHGPKGDVLAQAHSDAQGLARLHASGGIPERSYVIVHAGGEQPRLSLPEVSPENRYKLYLRTDRPLYRPGHQVSFYGVAMRDEEGRLAVAEGREVLVEARDNQDNVIYQKTLKSGAKGVFSGDLRLSAEPPLGRYRLSARCAPDHEATSLAFEVQDYRKPPFEVTVTPAEQLVIAGDNVTFDVHCAYFFGGAVAGAKLTYRLESQALYGEPDPPDDEPADHSYRYWKQEVARGEAVCDAAGRVRLSLPTARPDRDSLYTLHLQAVGEEGQEVEGSASTYVSPASYGVYVSPLEWLSQKGTPASLRVRTVDRLGKPHSAPVDIVIKSYSRSAPRAVVKTRVTTGADGTAIYTWATPSPGFFDVEVASRDGQGRRVENRSYLWVMGPGEIDYSYPALELQPQKHKVKPGETLRLLILTSRPGPLLLSVEGDKIHRQQRIQLKTRATVVELPISRDFAPNFTLKATLLHPKGLSHGEAQVRVPDQSHQVKIEISRDQVEYRPGESARLEFQALQKGLGLPVSLNVAVVDEALYALRGDFASPIFAHFYGARPNRVHTSTLWPRQARAAGFQTVESPLKVRSEFKDTALWRAQLLTDEQGRAHLDVPLPDNLTRWRTTVQAVGAPAEVGQAVTSFVTQLPLMVRWVTPRFLVEGDRAQLGGVVTNKSREADRVDVAFSTQAGKLPSPGRLSVDAGQSCKVPCPIQAPSCEEGNLELTVQARGQKASDGEKVSLPVLAFGRRHTHALSRAPGHGPVEAHLEVPTGVRQPTLDLRFSAGSRGVIQGALDYLADYPYGCVEQTMSRFLPTVVAVQASKELGGQLTKPVDSMVRAGLDKLYGYQHSDGGWGWWKEDETHPYMTGYVIYGLAATRAAGYPISEDVLKRGMGAARALLANLKDGQLETQVYLVWALTQAGDRPMADIQRLRGAVETMGTYSQALFYQAWRYCQPDDPDLARLLDRIRGRAVSQATSAGDAQLSWNGPSPQVSFWSAAALTPHGFVDDDLEATCLVLECLQEANPKDPLIAPALAWVLQQRQGERWKSTKDTARAVICLTRLNTGKVPQGEAPQVSLDGQKLALQEFGLEWRARVALHGGQGSRLTIEPSSPQSLTSLRLQYLSPAAASLSPENRGVKITRTYSNTTIAPQQRVTVTLTLECPANYDYVKLEDPRPAGTEVDSSNPQYASYSRREDRDDRSIFFFTRLFRGTTTIKYQLKGETPGSYRALPAQAELMYRPEIWGSSASQAFEITP